MAVGAAVVAWHCATEARGVLGAAPHLNDGCAVAHNAQLSRMLRRFRLAIVENSCCGMRCKVKPGPHLHLHSIVAINTEWRAG